MPMKTKVASVVVFSFLFLGFFIYWSATINDGGDSGKGKEINIINKDPIRTNNNKPKSGASYDCPADYTRFELDPNKPKPDFILIGVAKGGTTSFSQYLRE